MVSCRFTRLDILQICVDSRIDLRRSARNIDLPIVDRKAEIIFPGFFQTHIRKENQHGIGFEGFEAVDVAGRDDENFALGVGENMGMYG